MKNLRKILEELNDLDRIGEEIAKEVERRVGVELVYSQRRVSGDLWENEIAFYLEDVIGDLILTLNAISIADSSRGKGLGTKIMRELENVARDFGVVAIQLEAFPPGGAEIDDLKNLVKWYQRLGYELYMEREFYQFVEKAEEEFPDEVWYYSKAVNNPKLGTGGLLFWMSKDLL